MNILTIPLRNCRRKWPRTLLLLAVFALGVTSIVSLNHVSRTVGTSLEQKLLAYGANILVAPKTESLSVSYGGFSMGDMLYDIRYLDVAEVREKVRSIALAERISALAPKLVELAHVDGAPVGLVGVDWDEELRLKSYWGVEGAFPEAENEIVAGASAAGRLGLVPGAQVVLTTRQGEVRARVSGVLQPTGSEDDAVLLGGIGFVQTAAGLLGKANFVEVAALCSGCPIEDIVAQIGAGLPDATITAMQSVVKQRMFSVHFVQRLVMTVSLVILLIACAMVGLSMLSAVAERKKEIGILRALGYARSHIFTIFCAEAFFIGATAGGLGYLGGYAASFPILKALDITESTVVFEPWFLVLSSLAVALVSVLSAALPAAKAARVQPSEALISL